MRGATEAEVFDWQQWVTQVIGEMLSAAGSLPPPPNDRCAEALFAEATMSTAAGIRALAQRLQMSERGLHNIVLGRRVPQLETLLRICYCLGTTPLQLLAHRATPTNTMPRGTLLHEPNFHYRSHKPFDSDYVQRSLNQMISKNEMLPPSMAEVARQLGYDQSTLSERFPEL